MTRRSLWRRIGLAGGLAVVLLALCWPPPPVRAPDGPAVAPFAWRQGAVWDALESEFAALRRQPCGELEIGTASAFRDLYSGLERLESGPVPPTSPALDHLEGALFRLAPRVAACPGDVSDLLRTTQRLRRLVKLQSRAWSLGQAGPRTRLYRLLYGSRAAVEEVLLQLPPAHVPSLVRGVDEPSATPSTVIHGVRLHSGDLLVSRGGAPTSALISRGSDFPGNFSHAALLHVSPDGVPTVVEAHIERGTVPATAGQYLRDRKLRVMVLRLAADHPAVVADPLLPHRAASAALADGSSRHVPYDFAMDIADSGRRFCSEVAWAPYAALGVDLWHVRSTMSSPGLRRWLAGLGVRHFTTLAPSDLEYDPQLVVVAEWRDPQTLWQDHLDNAVVDAMLERAGADHDLPFSRATLPAARVAVAWSRLLNLADRVGPVPEGMTAAAALRSRRFSADHRAARAQLEAAAASFQSEHGYRPPYWELVRLARDSVSVRATAGRPGR